MRWQKIAALSRLQVPLAALPTLLPAMHTLMCSVRDSPSEVSSLLQQAGMCILTMSTAGNSMSTTGPASRLGRACVVVA